MRAPDRVHRTEWPPPPPPTSGSRRGRIRSPPRSLGTHSEWEWCCPGGQGRSSTFCSATSTEPGRTATTTATWPVPTKGPSGGPDEERVHHRPAARGAVGPAPQRAAVGGGVHMPPQVCGGGHRCEHAAARDEPVAAGKLDALEGHPRPDAPVVVVRGHGWGGGGVTGEDRDAVGLGDPDAGTEGQDG